MAVGIVIGAVFSTVVKSLVDDIIMRVEGMLTFVIVAFALFIVIKAMNAAKNAEAPAGPSPRMGLNCWQGYATP